MFITDVVTTDELWKFGDYAVALVGMSLCSVSGTTPKNLWTDLDESSSDVNPCPCPCMSSPY